MSTDAVARHLWQLYEPLHAVTYFAPEARAAFVGAGLRGFWRGYFAGRAAPLGAVPAAPVTALFYSFAPAMVARARSRTRMVSQVFTVRWQYCHVLQVYAIAK